MSHFDFEQKAAMRQELDSMCRIALTTPTARHRVAFGRLLRKAFLADVQLAGGTTNYRTFVSEWLQGREHLITDIIGNATAFLEDLATTDAASTVISNPKIFGQIKQDRQLHFARTMFHAQSSLLSCVAEGLSSAGFSQHDVQAFMLSIAVTYSGEEHRKHRAWFALEAFCRDQLNWNKLFRGLSDADCTRFVRLAVQNDPGLLINHHSEEIFRMLRYRLSPDAVEGLFYCAARSIGSGDFYRHMLFGPPLEIPGVLQGMGCDPQLPSAWHSPFILALAASASREVDLSAYQPHSLVAGLEYCDTKEQTFIADQHDVTPVRRMRHWCIDALLAYGYARSRIQVKDSVPRQYFVKYGGRDYYSAITRAFEPGQLVVFDAQIVGQNAVFIAIPEF
jgi:hypothetical protein